MEQNFLSVIKQGANTLIKTVSDNDLIFPTEAIEAINELTDNEEETFTLLSYLKDRYEEYDGSQGKEIKYSESFVKNLFISLLQTGFVPDQIMMALELIESSEIFGHIDSLKNESEEDVEDINNLRIEYICKRVKQELKFDSQFTTEEETYTSGR